jgi:hypothetical protein
VHSRLSAGLSANLVQIFGSSVKTGALKFKNELRSEGKIFTFFKKITSSKKCRLSDKSFAN